MHCNHFNFLSGVGYPYKIRPLLKSKSESILIENCLYEEAKVNPIILS